MAKGSFEHVNADGMGTRGPPNNGDAVVLKSSISMANDRSEYIEVAGYEHTLWSDASESGLLM